MPIRSTTTREGNIVDTDGYNGWKNYETWNIALWLDNDEGSYNEVRSLVRGKAGYEGAEALKDYVEQLAEMVCPSITEASFVSDMFGAAMSEVDWNEIFRHYEDERADDGGDAAPHTADCTVDCAEYGCAGEGGWTHATKEGE